MVKVPPNSYTTPPAPPKRKRACSIRPSEYYRRVPNEFQEKWWARGIPLPTMLPARLTRHRTLVGVDGCTLAGAGEGDRIYVVKCTHERTSPGNKVVYHPDYPGSLFYLWRSDYSIG